MSRNCALAVLMMAMTVRAAGEEPTPQDLSEAERASAIVVEEVRHWRLHVRDSKEVELRRTEKPVLRWSNPSAGRVYGDVYLWTRQGRPEAVVSVYKYFSPYQSLTAEFTSLSTSGLSAERDEIVRWKPEPGGLDLRAVPESPRTAETPAARLRQMRAIAARFSARLLDRRVDKEGTPQALRLLPQPIYRYEPGTEGAIDGGLFAIVLGTDPEVFLLLEAGGADAAGGWKYKLARMNVDEVRVTYGENEVWHAPQLTEFVVPERSYSVAELEDRR